MKWMILIMLFIITINFGCAKMPVSSSETPNGITVELIIEKDGMKVYRFYDAGHYRYFVDARGKTISSTQHTITQRIGKTTTTTTKIKPDEIETVDGIDEGE